MYFSAMIIPSVVWATFSTKLNLLPWPVRRRRSCVVLFLILQEGLNSSLERLLAVANETKGQGMDWARPVRMISSRMNDLALPNEVRQILAAAR